MLNFISWMLLVVLQQLEIVKFREKAIPQAHAIYWEKRIDHQTLREPKGREGSNFCEKNIEPTIGKTSPTFITQHTVKNESDSEEMKTTV
jgi:hypothetical protein